MKNNVHDGCHAHYFIKYNIRTENKLKNRNKYFPIAFGRLLVEILEL